MASRPGAVTHPAEGATVGTAAPAPDRSPAPVEPPPDGTDSGAQRASVSEPAPAAPATETEAWHDTDTFTLRVVTPEGEPLAGVEVGIIAGIWPESPAFNAIESGTSNERGEVYLQPFDYDSLRAKMAKGAPAGAGFRIHCVPPADEVNPIVVERNIAAGEVLELTVPAEVALRYRPLVVELLDHTGAPCPDVVVLLEGERESDPDEYSGMGKATTDAFGRAAIDLAESRRVQGFVALMGEVFHYRVAADLPFGDKPAVDLGKSIDNDEVITLKLPPTGAVQVDLVFDDDMPVAEAATFGLWTWPGGSDYSRWTHRVWNSSENGTTLFPYVGLGLDIEVSGRLASGRTENASQRLPGPVRAGETVRAELQLGPEWPWVTLRAVDERGQPLANEKLDRKFVTKRRDESERGKRPYTTRGHLETDSEGVARFQMVGRVAENYTRTIELEQVEQPPGQEKQRLRHGEVDFSWNPEPGAETHLGDVVLSPIAAPIEDVVWVEGHILAAGDGTPIRGASALVTPFDPDGTERKDLARNDRTDTKGHFVVEGPPFAGTLRVTAVASGHRYQKLEDIEPGTHGLDLRLERTAKWQGRILLDEGIPYQLLTVKVRGVNRSRSPDFYSQWLSVDGFEPGEITIEVETRHGDWLIERVEGLEASVEDIPPDPRVDPLDLRGRLALLRVRLIDPSGAPLSRVSVSVLPPPWGEGSAWTEKTGWLVLVLPSDVGTIRLRPSGYQSFECELVEGEQVFTCTPE